MRRLIIVALLVAAGIGAEAIAQTAPNSPPPPAAASGSQQGPQGRPPFAPIERINKIADNLYLIPGGGGTSLVWVYSTGVLLVDAKVPQNGAKLLEMIRRVTDKPLTYVVFTHAHGDHIGSVDEFPPGVQVVSHENTRTNILVTVEHYRDNEAAPGLPNHTFEDQMTLFHGKDTVELYYFGTSHTNGDIVVVFPAARAMHAGDIMKKKELPTFEPALGGSGVKFPATLKRIKTSIKNVDTVVGGHNDEVMSWNDFVRYSELSELLLAHEKASLRAGKSPEQTLADFKPPEKYQDFTLKPSSFGGVLAIRGTFDELQRTAPLQ